MKISQPHYKIPREAQEQMNAVMLRFPNCPKPGVTFIDASFLYAHPTWSDTVNEYMNYLYDIDDYDKIVAPEARGFAVAHGMAALAPKPVVWLRKWDKERGCKLYGDDVAKIQTRSEYDSPVLAYHSSQIQEGERILLVDDMFATGGTAKAVLEELKKRGAVPVGVAALVNLAYLDQVDLPEGCELRSMMTLKTPYELAAEEE